MNIIFTKHAKERIKTYNLSDDIVKDAIQNPDEIAEGYEETIIAHKLLNKHLLRVVYVTENNIIKIITVYPSKKERYYKKHKK